MECYKFKLVDPTEVFVDATHVKARTNDKKMQKQSNATLLTQKADGSIKVSIRVCLPMQ